MRLRRKKPKKPEQAFKCKGCGEVVAKVSALGFCGKGICSIEETGYQKGWRACESSMQSHGLGTFGQLGQLGNMAGCNMSFPNPLMQLGIISRPPK